MATTSTLGDAKAELRFVLAHGAGAGLDSPFMTALAESLIEAGAAVTLIEFDYMRDMRETGRRRPPSPIDRLILEYADCLDTLIGATPARQRIVIGGKSLGGRVASLVATDASAMTRVSAWVCFGYPFHPPRAPDKIRTAHFAHLAVPGLILQGTRDPFGNRAFVAGLSLPRDVRIDWLADGDHDFTPRVCSGGTSRANIAEAARVAAVFARQISAPR